MPEKRIRTLPTVRVSETLEMSLMRSAARDDRTLSDYIRRILQLHEFGHSSIVAEDSADDNDNGALQRNSTGLGTR